jgi:hypothetical protein
MNAIANLWFLRLRGVSPAEPLGNTPARAEQLARGWLGAAVGVLLALLDALLGGGCPTHPLASLRVKSDLLGFQLAESGSHLVQLGAESAEISLVLREADFAQPEQFHPTSVSRTVPLAK